MASVQPDLVVEDLEDAKEAPSSGLFGALGGDAEEEKAKPKDTKKLKRKGTKNKNQKAVKRRATGEPASPDADQLAASCSGSASGPTQEDVPPGEDDEETKEHSPRNKKKDGGGGAAAEEEEIREAEETKGGGDIETGNGPGGGEDKKRKGNSGTEMRTKSGRKINNPDRKSLIPKGDDAGGGGAADAADAEEEPHRRQSSTQIKVPLFVEATRHELARRDTWERNKLLEQQRKPKNLTLDYILHSAAMVVTFAALTAHVLAYLSYAGGAGGARASPAVSQAMFAAVLAPHLLTSLLVARKAFSFPWCVLLCFSWVALPLAGVVLTIYEFERATMFVGGRHAMDTFRRRSSFTAISGIPVHEYEALRNLCLLLTGDLPMMGLAAVAGFATERPWVSPGVAAFALAASGAHALLTCAQVYAQAKPLFVVTESKGAQRIGACKYSAFVLGCAAPNDQFAEAYARLLKDGNYGCAVLKLSGGAITDAGAEHLAKGLESPNCVHLLRLNLGDNCISTDGAERLATALEANTIVKEIDLYNQSAENNTPLPRMIYEQVAVRTNYRITIDFSSQVKLY